MQMQHRWSTDMQKHPPQSTFAWGYRERGATSKDKQDTIRKESKREKVTRKDDPQDDPQDDPTGGWPPQKRRHRSLDQGHIDYRTYTGWFLY